MSSLYKAIGQQKVEVFAHREIQGEPLSDELPITPELDACLSMVGSGNGKQRSERSHAELTRISPYHRRSYALPCQQSWRDRFGNLFAALNSKGNDCTDLHIFKTGLSPSGFAVHGLQEAHAMVRMLRASQYLRMKRVHTEIIGHALEPSELPIGGTTLPIPQFKQRLLERAVHLAHTPRSSTNAYPFEMPGIDDIPAVVKAIREMLFFITIRGTQVNERVADLTLMLSEEGRTAMLEPAFEFVNEEARLLAQENGTTMPTSLSAADATDVDQFLHEILPDRAADTFTNMHNSGVWHVFPHGGNVSLVGSIYDLDSARGEPLELGDERISDKAREHDIMTFLDDIGQKSQRFSLCDTNRFRKRFLDRYGATSPKYSKIFLYWDALIEHLDSSPELERIAFSRLAQLFRISVRHRVEMLLTAIEEYRISTHKETDNAVLLAQLLKKFLIEEYGQRYPNQPLSVLGIIKLFARERVMDILGTRVFDEDLDRDPPGDLLQQAFAQKEEFEKDVVGNAVAISELFDGFESPAYHEQLLYYRALAVKQLGWDYRPSFGLRELMESFHASEEAALRAHILSAVAKNKSREQSDPVAEALRSFDSIHDPQARYCAFAIDAIEKDFQNASAQSGTLARVSQQYDAATAEVLEHWLKAYWWHEYNDGLTEEIEEEIIRRADARVEMIRNTQTATDIASRSVDIL